MNHLLWPAAMKASATRRLCVSHRCCCCCAMAPSARIGACSRPGQARTRPRDESSHTFAPSLSSGQARSTCVFACNPMYEGQTQRSPTTGESKQSASSCVLSPRLCVDGNVSSFLQLRRFLTSCLLRLLATSVFIAANQLLPFWSVHHFS